MEELQAKHRKEQRDIQSRITQKKKQATKKTRKGVNDECEQLQRDLLEKQQTEIAHLNGETEVPVSLDDLNIDDSKPVEDGDKTAGASSETAAQSNIASPPSEQSQPKKKANRQKARLARRAAEREADVEQAAAEAANQKDNRGDERKIMNETFSRLGLKEIDIRPDGHCLYSAVANQLSEFGMSLTPGMTAGDKPSVPTSKTKFDGYRNVRAATADFLRANPDDFAAFLEEPIHLYAEKIKSTTEWGGQLELQAMARAYGIHINVIQVDGRIEKFEPNAEKNVDEDRTKTIWLAYYRHTYGLGEHYNALSKQS